MSWDFQIAKPGSFRVEISYACDTGSGDSTYEIAVGGEQVEGKVRVTGSWTTVVTDKLGVLRPPSRKMKSKR